MSSSEKYFPRPIPYWYAVDISLIERIRFALECIVIGHLGPFIDSATWETKGKSIAKDIVPMVKNVMGRISGVKGINSDPYPNSVEIYFDDGSSTRFIIHINPTWVEHDPTGTDTTHTERKRGDYSDWR